MWYPKHLDVTPIVLTNKEQTFSGLSDIGTQDLNVRMEFGDKRIKDQNGNDVVSQARFYKYGTVEANYGDEVAFESKTYQVLSIRHYRMPNGAILYTRVDF